MICKPRFLVPLFCLGLVLSGPVPAQPAIAPPPPASAADRQAIAERIRDQIQACWSMPAGYEGQRFTVNLAFLGDGTLDGEPGLAPVQAKSASKLDPLMQSALRAIKRCAPFEGLEALGAGARERFSIAVDFAS